MDRVTQQSKLSEKNFKVLRNKVVKIKKKYTRNAKQISHVSSMSSFGVDPADMDERRPGSQVPVTPWLR